MVDHRDRSGKGVAFRKTVWGLADQSVVSLGNFCTTLFLIRSLPPQAFGKYALILNSAIFLNNLQQSLVGYPLWVRGSQADATRFRQLVASAMAATGGLFLVNTLVLYCIASRLGDLALLVPLAAAVLLWQMQDTLRGAFQSQLRQREAVAGDAISYLGQAMIVALLCRINEISVAKAWWITAGTSLLALLLQLWQLRPSVAGATVLSAMLRDFWLLGRWTVPARIMGFFTLQAFPWAIAMRHGTGEVATFQALFQIIALTNPVLLSMSSLMTASIARSRAASLRDSRLYILLTVVVTGAYLVLVGMAAPQVLSVLYGSNGLYTAHADTLRMLAFGWSFEVVALICTSVLGGMERTTGLLWVQLTGCVGATIALPLVYWHGLVAAAGGLLLVNTVRAACGVALVMYARSGRWNRKEIAPSGLMVAGERAA